PRVWWRPAAPRGGGCPRPRAQRAGGALGGPRRQIAPGLPVAMRRGAVPDVVANPILVGAATLLVAVVGVFLAYNANSGLPFVPVYRLTAVVPDAAELVPGNDVRIGGKRVGEVTSIEAQEAPGGRVSARVHLLLEKT